MDSKRFLVTTDDICPRFIENYWHYWDELKKKFPKLLVLAFTVPFFGKCLAEDVSQSERFVAWLSARKDWVFIGLHGFDHGAPPEYTRAFHEKRVIIGQGCQKLKEFFPEKWSAKAPGNKIDQEAAEILAFFGCRWVFLDSDVIYDTEFKTLNKINRVIDTHTNGRSEDSIEKIYRELEKVFVGIDFINPGEMNEHFSVW